MRAFILVSALIAAAIYGGARAFLAGLLVLAIISILRKKRRNSDIATQLESAKMIITAHEKELSIRRNQLTVKQNYGLINDKKWKKEVEIFVLNIIEPKIGVIDVFSKNYALIRNAIDESTESYSESRSPFSKDISPVEYEQLVAGILDDCGWNTRLTATSGDQGVDVIAEKQGVKIVIQCKLYSSSVGNGAVQEVIAGKAFERADFAVVVTNADFTRSARQLAYSSGVFLMHHDQLNSLASVCGIPDLTMGPKAA